MGLLSDVLAHPEEFLPLCKMALAAKQATKLPKHPDLAFCYDVLNNVSRSFAVVIQQLPNPLRDAICIFYLVLRGLDTVEDDMALSNDIKLPMLLAFHKKIYERYAWHRVCLDHASTNNVTQGFLDGLRLQALQGAHGQVRDRRQCLLGPGQELSVGHR